MRFLFLLFFLSFFSLYAMDDSSLVNEQSNQENASNLKTKGFKICCSCLGKTKYYIIKARKKYNDHEDQEEHHEVYNLVFTSLQNAQDHTSFVQLLDSSTRYVSSYKDKFDKKTNRYEVVKEIYLLAFIESNEHALMKK